MTFDLLVSQLRLGKTGTEILDILNAITGNQEEEMVVCMNATQPTMDEIQF